LQLIFMSKKKPRKITFVTFSQSIFLTIKYFFQNRLLSFAGSCAFSFLFSVIPLFMMIVMVLVRFLHASPKTISAIIAEIPELERYFNSDSVIQSLQSIKSVSSFEIVAGLFILWMARRFFASIFDSMQNIFHIQTKRKALINQILTFVTELLIVLVASSIIFAYISLQTISSLSFIKELPQLHFLQEGILSGDLINILPNILILMAMTVLFKTGSGTKPKFLLCLTVSFLCTASFWVFRIILHYFLNISRYNLIYGVLGHVIILFMDIFFFFVFFLLFAQYIYVLQFFDELLLGELYLLPKIEESGIAAGLKRAMFIRPDFLIAKNKGNILTYSPGDVIFSLGDEDDSAYYIIKGTVKFLPAGGSEESPVMAHRGEFFGETACILEQKREINALAVISTRLIRIDSQAFRFLVHQNPEAAKKVLAQISPYF
nr:YihY/virulence factor BrkB family protein [Treponema sp.]